MNCLETAASVVDGPRNLDYGEPEDNHRACARLWNAYILEKAIAAGGQIALSAADVCYMMVLLKVSRQIHGNTTRDTCVDIAGYARNVEILTFGWDDKPELVEEKELPVSQSQK